MKLIDASRDAWQEVTADDSLVAVPAVEPHRLLSAAQWQAVRGNWPADVPVGLAIANDADVETIADDLPRLSVIALRFPKWTDGRAYSQAHLLRSRWRWPGELRATGDVVVDMLPLLVRTGFDAAALRADQSPAHAERTLELFAEGHYQGDVHQTRPHFAREAGRSGSPSAAA